MQDAAPEYPIECAKVKWTVATHEFRKKLKLKKWALKGEMVSKIDKY